MKKLDYRDLIKAQNGFGVFTIITSHFAEEDEYIGFRASPYGKEKYEEVEEYVKTMEIAIECLDVGDTITHRYDNPEHENYWKNVNATYNYAVLYPQYRSDFFAFLETL